MSKRGSSVRAVAIAVAIAWAATPTLGIGSAFTYQGQLQQGPNAVNGTCDLQFLLFNDASAGMQLGSSIEHDGVTFTNGLFTIQLDFGAAAFDGGDRFLQIAVRCPAGSGDFNSLTPRQPITTAPYALLSGGLVLPFNQSASSSAGAFHIENDGSGGAATFTAMSATAVIGVSTGGVGVEGTSTSNIGVFAVTEGASTPGLRVENNGGGDLIDAGQFVNPIIHLGSEQPVHSVVIGPHYVKKFRVDNSGKGYFDGGIDSTGGADVAERVPSSDPLEPGDVVEIDATHPGQFRRSAGAYSTLVAGIVSTQPGVTLGAPIETGPAPALALSGRVPVKVTAEAGAIHVGDLLTSSSTPGYAMRCDDRAKCVGAIVGKALGVMESGNGTITTLVTLQ
jgi:hypothetical protein